MHVARATDSCGGNIAVTSADLLWRIVRLEAALAASQTHAQQHLSVKTLEELDSRMAQLRARNAATKARLAKAAKQQRRLSRQHVSLRKAHRRAERQKATLQQKAVQLKQLLTAMLGLGSSMQRTHNSMTAQVEQIKGEMARVERQLQALHIQAEVAKTIKADFGGQAGAAAGDTSVKKSVKQVRGGHAVPFRFFFYKRLLTLVSLMPLTHPVTLALAH